MKSTTLRLATCEWHKAIGYSPSLKSRKCSQAPAYSAKHGDGCSFVLCKTHASWWPSGWGWESPEEWHDPELTRKG
jgi:hypothetical protein